MGSRSGRIQQRLAKLYIDAFLVTNQQSIYHNAASASFRTTALLITPDRAIIVSDERYLALEKFASEEVVATISQTTMLILTASVGLQVEVRAMKTRSLPAL